MTEIEKQLNLNTVADLQDFTPTTATEPESSRRCVKQGEKSVYVEHNSGTININ